MVGIELEEIFVDFAEARLRVARDVRFVAEEMREQLRFVLAHVYLLLVELLDGRSHLALDDVRLDFADAEEGIGVVE